MAVKRKKIKKTNKKRKTNAPKKKAVKKTVKKRSVSKTPKKNHIPKKGINLFEKRVKAKKERLKKQIASAVNTAKKLFGGNFKVKHIAIKQPERLFQIGTLEGVLYKSSNTGKHYKHIFKSKPSLCYGQDLKSLYIVGGNYKIKKTGING
ncbi:MAG TPA: hypothetical protein PKY81_15045 [bacterium]|nr:hypothetical protein [bacterium]HPN32266.1 hypothetical protein [bacterium]